MQVSSLRTPIILGDFFPNEIEEEQPKTLDRLFRERVRLTNQIQSSRSRRRARHFKVQLRAVNKEILSRQNEDRAEELPSGQEASSSAAVSIEPALEREEVGGGFGFLGIISVIGLGLLGAGAIVRSISGSKNSLSEVESVVNSIVEVVKKSPTTESSIALIKSVRNAIKGDSIVNSWSPCVRRAFNRAIDDLLRQVNRGKLLEGLSYEIGTGRSIWGIRGTFNLITSWMK